MSDWSTFQGCRSCRFWANQYGAGFSFCETHGLVWSAVSDLLGKTPQEAFDAALAEFMDRVSV